MTKMFVTLRGHAYVAVHDPSNNSLTIHDPSDTEHNPLGRTVWVWVPLGNGGTGLWVNVAYCLGHIPAH